MPCLSGFPRISHIKKGRKTVLLAKILAFYLPFQVTKQQINYHIGADMYIKTAFPIYVISDQ